MMAWQKVLIWVGSGMVFFSLYRIALLVSQWSLFRRLPLGMRLKALFVGMRFDISILLTFLVPSIAMVLIPISLAEGAGWLAFWGWFAYAVEMVLVFILVADLLYFPSVGRHLAGELAMLGSDKASMSQLVWLTYRFHLLAYIVFAIVMGVFWNKLQSLPFVPTPFAPVVFVILGLLIFLAIRGTTKGKSINVIDAFRAGNQLYGNLLLNGVFSAYHATRSGQKANHSFYPADKTVQDSALRYLSVKDEEYPLMSQLPDVQPNKRNIVFVLLESWSTKYVDSFRTSGATVGVTPNFDRLAAQGLKFSKAFASGQRSIHAIQASLTGVPALPGMPLMGKGLEVTRVSQVGHMLRTHGYQSVFVKSSKRRSFRVDSIAKSCGFGEYYGWEDMEMLLDYPDPKASVFGWDYETFFELLKRNNELEEPFFGYMFTGATHMPYPNPGEQFMKREHDERGENGFLNALYYSDWSLGEFFKEAEKQPWYDNTTFVLTADHPLGWFRTGRFLENFEVPVLLYAPGVIESGTIDTVVSHCDLMPTILELAGVGEEYAALGESMLRKKKSWAMVEMGLTVGWVDERGYLAHSLTQPLDSGTFNDEPLAQDVIDDMEQQLLATAQLSLNLVKGNRWVRP